MVDSAPLIALDFVIKNALLALDDDCYNKYIKFFITLPWICELRDIARTDYSVKQIMNHKSLKKEITETMGALRLAERASRRLIMHECVLGGRSCPEFSSNLLNFEALKSLGKSLIIYDVCSGKGIASFLMAFFLPEARIVMIDFNSRIRVDHLNHTRCRNITFLHVDIYKSEFEKFFIADSKIFDSELEKAGVVLALGLHLCGNLSLRLTSLFNSTQAIDILILSPCCMPRKGKGGQKVLMEKLKRNRWCNYTYWCMNIYHSIDPQRAHRDLYRDTEVESEKSIFITSLKSTYGCFPCNINSLTS